jgi:DNA-binding MarR family transcriptional regulator
MAGRSNREAAADRLHSAAIHLLRRVRESDEETGLSPARLSALSVVVFGGPMTLGALARAEQVRPPPMTPIVAALERDGLVHKRGGTDRRTVEITATAKGRRLMQRARRRRLDTLEALLRPLTAADLDVVARAADLVEQSVRTARD